MNIAFDTYKQKLNDCRPALDGLADSLNIEGMRNELERLHAMQEAPGFWDDPEKSQKVAVKTRQTETKIERYEKMLTDWDDLMTICEMAAEEDDCRFFRNPNRYNIIGFLVVSCFYLG